MQQEHTVNKSYRSTPGHFWSTPVHRRHVRATHAFLCTAALAVSGCVQAQVPQRTDETTGTIVQTVERRVSHPPQLQETPSVLLPGSYYDTTRSPLLAGSQAPDFTLPFAVNSQWRLPGAKRNTTKDMSKLKLSSFLAMRHGTASTKQSSVTVLVFWAFWCDTWKDVTRDFKKLRPQLTNAGAGVLCVSVDASQQPVARRAFASGEIWFPVLIDIHGGAGRAADGQGITTSRTRAAKAIDNQRSVGATFGVRRVPTFFVLDSTGRIRTRFEGFPGNRRLLQSVRDAGFAYKAPTAVSVANKSETKAP